ncbi:hypothetical protein MJO28_000996 [Puccinia striiformis f. sp. tritici]|uniref:Uncharacterized protein n=1 Tax=Puccinia striiformis f. sp. tritici TaxID=168172 RepID=A0ACC0EZK7_9BASI|nr:hypothetical protein MJO28_000996 [Puccinia striiformis f. sp. tritici]
MLLTQKRMKILAVYCLIAPQMLLVTYVMPGCWAVCPIQRGMPHEIGLAYNRLELVPEGRGYVETSQLKRYKKRYRDLLSRMAEDAGTRKQSRGGESSKGKLKWVDEFELLQTQLAIFEATVLQSGYITDKDTLLSDIQKLKIIQSTMPTTAEHVLLLKVGDRRIGLGPLEEKTMLKTSAQAGKPIDKPIDMKKDPTFNLHLHLLQILDGINLAANEMTERWHTFWRTLSSDLNQMRPRTPAVEVGKLKEVSVASNPASGKTITNHQAPIPLEPELWGDVLDEVRRKAARGWSEPLNVLLHEIMPLESALEVAKASKGPVAEWSEYSGHYPALLLQQFVFRTVELIHKHEFITTEDLKEFLKVNDTVRLAVINLFESYKILWHLWGWYHECFHDFRYSKLFVNLVNEGIEKIDPELIIERRLHHCSPYGPPATWPSRPR